MNTRIRIASGIAVAALAASGLGIATGPANAAPDQTSDRSSATQARQSQRDFNPTLRKVNFHEILAQAEHINRSNTIKLMSDRNGTWRTIRVWNPSNARDRDFAQTVRVRSVGRINRYVLRVVDRNFRGRVIQVQDSRNTRTSTAGGNNTGGGGNTSGGGNGGGNTGGGDGGLLGGLGL